MPDYLVTRRELVVSTWKVSAGSVENAKQKVLTETPDAVVQYFGIEDNVPNWSVEVLNEELPSQPA